MNSIQLRKKQQKQALLAHLKNCKTTLQQTSPDEKLQTITRLFRQLAGVGEPKMNPSVFDEDVTKELLEIVRLLEA